MTSLPNSLTKNADTKGGPDFLLEQVDLLRLSATNKLEQSQRSQMGQFLTSSAVAELMAKMFIFDQPVISLLDSGAGVGSLFAAVVAELCKRRLRPQSLHITAYEIDSVLVEYLEQTLSLCHQVCKEAGIAFTSSVRQVDFICDAVTLLQPSIFCDVNESQFTTAILNPPYRKIHTQSNERKWLSSIGIETSNLYTAFMAIAAMLLQPGGELVTITPRSFCNGPYFRDFRTMFLRTMALRRMHLFDSRQDAFRDDAVLQETIIVYAAKQQQKPQSVLISSSAGADDDLILSSELAYTQVVYPNDPEKFIHVVPDSLSQQIAVRMRNFSNSLGDLGLTVSTGRVVDFRAKAYLRTNLEPGTFPLIYPVNFSEGQIVWPKLCKKPQAIAETIKTEPLLVPNENYVLTKRFTSKEERKRIVAAVYDASKVFGKSVGFENHLNYFHRNGKGLDLALARGLAAYLNSSLVDAYFRQFNGHTQVNATDLRSLKFPNLSKLRTIGEQVGDKFLDQRKINELLDKELLNMTDITAIDPIAVKSRIAEGIEVLKALELPRSQVNERSALTLLSLLHLKPSTPWSQASTPLLGITPIMEFMKQYYGKEYAPNTRETVRRRTVHQFIEAGLVVANPDRADRPINSPDYVYKIIETALELLQTYSSADWNKSLQTYLASIDTLKKRYAQERQMARIPIQIGEEILSLSPGGQNVLIERVINEFGPRFTPGGELLYIGDTGEKYAYFKREMLAELGVEIDTHGKMPDLIIYFPAKNWLVLIEAVTSHGPIDPKRKAELTSLFQDSTAGLVLVTTFLSRKAMTQYLPEISWETDVWIAEAPTHLIHFNGENLLQAYEGELPTIEPSRADA